MSREMDGEFRQFWKDWDNERAREWLRERYLSFRLHHAELGTEALPETFADLFVQWCEGSTARPVTALTLPCCGAKGAHASDCVRNTVTPERPWWPAESGDPS